MPIVESIELLRNEEKDKLIDLLQNDIHKLKTQFERYQSRIRCLDKTIIKQSKDLRMKDGIINQLRKEKEEDHEIQLTEVIRERKFIEIHTVDDREEESSQSRHCGSCRCLVNTGVIFESDDDKVNRLRINLEDKDKTIKKFEEKVKNQDKRITTKDRIIEHQFKTIVKQSKELKSKDGIINQLRHRWARVLGQGGCVHRGVFKEKICGRLRRPKFFFHRGVKIFFLRGVLLVDRGVILQKNDKK